MNQSSDDMKDSLSNLSYFGDSFDGEVFTAEDALRLGLDPLELEELQMLADPSIITDSATEDSFRLDQPWKPLCSSLLFVISISGLLTGFLISSFTIGFVKWLVLLYTDIEIVFAGWDTHRARPACRRWILKRSEFLLIVFSAVKTDFYHLDNVVTIFYFSWNYNTMCVVFILLGPVVFID